MLDKILLYFSYDIKNDIRILREVLKEKLTKEEMICKIINIYNLNMKIINDVTNYMKIKLINSNIRYITYFDEEYPKLLKEIYDFPIVLYYCGNIELLKFDNKISIVGSRKPSIDGIKMCKNLGCFLKGSDYVVVSGLAFGIDENIHKSCLDNNVYTIAVIPSGLNNIVPKSNLNLVDKILNNKGLIISEFWIEHISKKWEYIYRNRIISGISKKVFIIEASKNSGSINTANHAIEQNREVYAMVGSIFNKVAEGTNELIKNGANVVCSCEDLFEGEKFYIKKENNVDEILNYINVNNEITIDELLDKFDIKYNELIVKLTDFEISGKINLIGDVIKVI